jgi:hypothetical protein
VLVYDAQMQCSFTLAGERGHVDVMVAVNSDPETLGCRPAARGFPYCCASVTHPARGYAAVLGWIQLVRSTDGASGGASFEMDPFEPLGLVSHPFAFFGFLPTLFDGPSRDPIVDMDWTAHSFLGCLGEYDRTAQAILGFSWGFAIREGMITPRGPAALAPQDWDEHRATLAREHSGWSFTPGFQDA